MQRSNIYNIHTTTRRHTHNQRIGCIMTKCSAIVVVMHLHMLTICLSIRHSLPHTFSSPLSLKIPSSEWGFSIWSICHLADKTFKNRSPVTNHPARICSIQSVLVDVYKYHRFTHYTLYETHEPRSWVRKCISPKWYLWEFSII